MSYKVLLLDGVSPVCGEILTSKGIAFDQPSKLSDAELKEILPNYQAMVVRSATTVTKDLLKFAPNMRVVGRAGVGVDNIDIAAATEAGVLVMNTPDGNTISTAEHTCGLIMALSRNIYNAVKSVKDGAWDRKKYMGTELDGKVLGIIGLGKIGASVATRMKSFGMKVIGFDPFTSKEKAAEMGVELLSLDEVMAKSDFLTVHTPLTDKTRGLISMNTKDKLKKGVRIVNCARGGIIEEADVLNLLESGIVGGFAIDVYSSEPLTDELKEIMKHPNIISTPHLGASTEEAQEKVAEQMAYQIADALEMQDFKGSINGKSIALSTNKEVQPYLKLGEILGKFAAQIALDNTANIGLLYTGKCAEHSEVLTDAVLKGFLQQTTDAPINLINARYIADGRGLKVVETSMKKGKTYTDLIQIELIGQAPFYKISAAVFGDNDYRIVEIDGFGIELKMEGDIVMYKNDDKPGMLAAAASSFAKQDINIAALSLGRETKGTSAITALTVDKSLSEAELQPIRDMSGVSNVHYVKL